MKPGRELDLLIDIKIIGGTYNPAEQCIDGYGCLKHLTIPHYSTDIAAAWKVVDYLIEKKMSITVTCLPIGELKWFFDDPPPYNKPSGEKRFVCNIAEVRPNLDKQAIIVGSEYGESTPHAICLAALKAVNYNFDATEGSSNDNHNARKN